MAPNTVLGLEINGDFLEIEIKSPLNVRIGSRKSFKRLFIPIFNNTLLTSPFQNFVECVEYRGNINSRRIMIFALKRKCICKCTMYRNLLRFMNENAVLQ